MTILWTLGEHMMTCIDTAYFLLLPIFQLRCKYWVPAKHILGYAMFIIVTVTIYNYYTAHSISVIFVSVTLLLLYNLLFIQGRWLLKLFWLFFPFALLYGTELTTFGFITYIYPHITIDVFPFPNVYRLQMLIYSKTIETSLLVFLLNFKLDLAERSNVVFAVALLSSASIMFGLIGHLIGFSIHLQRNPFYFVLLLPF